MLELIITVTCVVAGAFMYRWRGKNKNDVPVIFKSRLVRRLMCGIIPGVAIGAITGVWYMIPVVAVLMYYGIIVGHGSYFPRGKDGEPNEDNENFAFITKLIADPMNETARFVGMAITGLVTTAPVALIMLCPLVGFNWAIAAFAISGVLKAPVYWLTPDTEVAEWVTGVVFGGIVMIPFLFI